MSTRSIVPRATGEGSIGTTLLRWATAFINAITCTTINALTLAAAAVGFTLSGGTTSKTLTVTADTDLDEAVPMSSKAPKASPVFTGNVKGASGDTFFAAVNATNAGIFSVGGGSNSGTVSLLDNQSITITYTGMGLLVSIGVNHTGYGALFFIVYSSATIVVLADPNSEWVTTDIDSAKLAIFKAATSCVITIKNYANATRSCNINILGGTVESSTAPA